MGLKWAVTPSDTSITPISPSKSWDITDTSMPNLYSVSPGTLFIGETMLTEDNDTELVEYLAQVLYQLEARGLYQQVESIDFSDKYNVVFDYGDKYTVKLGGPGDTEYKFGMLVSVMSQLLEGDIGVIDVSDGATAHFKPM